MPRMTVVGEGLGSRAAQADQSAPRKTEREHEGGATVPPGRIMIMAWTGRRSGWLWSSRPAAAWATRPAMQAERDEVKS